MLRHVALALTLLTITQNSPIFTRLDKTTLSSAQIDATVNHLIQAGHVTGAAIALFNHDQLIYLGAYGLRDTDRKLPLTSDSVMTAASLSKSAFAVLVMQLVHDHTLSLDKPVYRYLPKPLPEYPRYADLKSDDRYKKLTLRILLDHTSGFPNWRSFTDDQKLNINFDPGTRFAYSGEGIDLAQLVVETVTHQSLTTLMQDRVFKPLHMARSSMTWQPAFESDFANGYDEQGHSLGPQRRTQPDAAGSMQTTPRDYATLLSAIMLGTFLDPFVQHEMLKPQIRIHSAHEFPSLATETTTANDAIQLSYGIGWGLYSSPYGRAFFKEGHDEGWRNYALCFANGTGILIMTNSSNGEGIFKPLLESLLGKTYVPIEWEGYTPYTELPPPPPPA